MYIVCTRKYYYVQQVISVDQRLAEANISGAVSIIPFEALPNLLAIAATFIPNFICMTNTQRAQKVAGYIRKMNTVIYPEIQKLKVRKHEKFQDSDFGFFAFSQLVMLKYKGLEIFIYVTDGNIMYLTDASRFLISCVIQHYAPVVGCRNRCIMLIMSLYPSWRQTLRLPPPGTKPGSPASQAGTLPKELSRQLKPVMRIRDFYPRSRILIFSHPGSWIQNSNKREG